MSNLNELMNISSDMTTNETYTKIRSSVIAAQGRVYTAVNAAMVQAYLGDRRADIHCLR